MHKHHQNLERLCQKLQFRYGEDDGLVMQLKHELESLESRQSKDDPQANRGRRKQDKEVSSAPVH
ncbi:hypothetical protein [Polaromonas hydrogenivorans]|uniref:DUF465 domain-containing protein n=1 Tax=Polaromonas hydrogenivorans TaxID=335476 RepID=A0AAU7LVD4_9BURK